jgi:type IV pilus assembly protein PilB
MSRYSPDPDIMMILSEKLIRRYSVMVLSKIGDNIALVTSDPTDILAIDDIKTVTGCNVEIVLSTKQDIRRAIESFYSEEENEFSEIIEKEETEEEVEVLDSSDGFDLGDISRESTMAPIVKMVDLIIMEALKKRSSDIHIEPEEKSLMIRYRIDGALQKAFELPKSNQNAIIARLKIMSNLDITENRVPQDGRFRIRFENKEIDFRVSILPTIFGNKIVLRALDKSNLSIGLESLGFLPEPLDDFNTALSRPFGIILVTGPTGSGKSTTLYSVLNNMNVPERNIVTVEDPVEYQVPGITQIAAKPEIGLDFSQGLRAILRQSPDIILVGEIRDFETADIAIKASLTGQMVLSTLHTNDSVGAITRLINMGIEPFLVSSSLVMACAQRLLRKICPNCRTEIKLPDRVFKELRDKYPEAPETNKFYKGKGCPRCNNTGFKGRMATLETLLVDDTIREMINQRKPESDIRQYLKEKKVRTLRDNAMIKFFKGLTTLEEVMRIT